MTTSFTDIVKLEVPDFVRVGSIVSHQLNRRFP
jgi:hypothetical protein